MMKLRKRPLSVSHVCEHSKKFWFGKEGLVDYRDVILHAVLVVGLNLGFGKYRDVINRNSTFQSDYKIREWPGNADMRKTLLMDPFVAVLLLICARGNTDGYMFGDVNEKEMMGYGTPWSN